MVNIGRYTASSSPTVINARMIVMAGSSSDSSRSVKTVISLSKYSLMTVSVCSRLPERSPTPVISVSICGKQLSAAMQSTRPLPCSTPVRTRRTA